jgi:hypothetical protein
MTVSAQQTPVAPPLWSPQGWFLRLARRVLRGGHPERLQRDRDRGLSDAAIRERLVSYAAFQAAVVGGMAGLGATVSEIASIPTFGVSLALLVGISGAELSYLTYAQLRLVQSLAYLYGIDIDHDNPQDVLTIFGFAQGLRPTELVVTTFTRTGEAATATALREYTTRQTARFIQRLARNVGWELLEHTVIKYAVPIVSIFAGAIINYATIRSLGRIARAYFRQLRVRDGVFQTMAAEHRFQAAFPALALHTAQVSGMRRDQQHLYQMLQATLGDGLRQEDAWLLDADQPALDEFLRQVEDPRTRRALMDTCILMALVDVNLTAAEKQYLEHVSQVLDVPVDMPKVEQAFRDLHPRGLSAYLVAVSRWGCLFFIVLGSLLLLCWLALFLFYLQVGALFVYGLFSSFSRF